MARGLDPPIPWSVAAVACVRFRLCRFSVLMVFRLVAASVKLWGEHGASSGVGVACFLGVRISRKQ